jgi:hypothetical protein
VYRHDPFVLVAVRSKDMEAGGERGGRGQASRDLERLEEVGREPGGNLGGEAGGEARGGWRERGGGWGGGQRREKEVGMDRKK